MEAEFGAIERLERTSSEAAEGFASVQVRETADRAEGELPEDTHELTVTEIDTALVPIITAILFGPIPERTLTRLAKDVQAELEKFRGVLEVDIGGARGIPRGAIDPTVFQTYNLNFDALMTTLSATTG